MGFFCLVAEVVAFLLTILEVSMFTPSLVIVLEVEGRTALAFIRPWEEAAWEAAVSLVLL